MNEELLELTKKIAIALASNPSFVSQWETECMPEKLAEKAKKIVAELMKDSE